MLHALDESRILHAKHFALKKHYGLRRPNRTQEPIWKHLEETADLVRFSGGTTEEIIAGWTHDTLEDTKTTADEIEEMFGRVVRELVNGLTDPPEFEALPLLQRKLAQAERIKGKSRGVKRVKISDQTSNTRLVTRDPPTAWNRIECVHYIYGAAAIVKECADVSPYLDATFATALREAYHVYPELRSFKVD
jgi:(p)ppGpp synthase/HD superfamily hydrolase